MKPKHKETIVMKVAHMGKAALHRNCGKGCLALVFCLFSLWVPTQAQEVASNPAGFFRITLLGNSDTIVSLPYLRPAAASGLVASVSGNVLTVSGSTSWTASQFVYQPGVQANTYFMTVLSGAKEGFYYPIVQSTSDALTLNLADDTLDGMLPGDRIAVHPYWTLGTIFPKGRAVHASSSQLIRKTEILIPNYQGTGINLSAIKTYYFLNDDSGGTWRQFAHSGIKDDDVILPDVMFIVRHNIDTDTTLTVQGDVASSKWAIPLSTLLAGKQDNIVALPRPIDVSLNNSGLIESGAFASSPSRLVRTDELLVFNNTLKQKNKSAAATYYYCNGMWQRFPLTDDVGDEKPFKAGTGIIIRKASGPTIQLWINEPGY
ncbi:MAG TPA: TIGR02597 family protein [Candidatus Paceibacterota bacterium]|nr:TIGR02597 family protein [Verrucomicrobiota bacterium]HRY48398.1 TIGR02597 family protein [Candidatus Paceibacterota bacterium]